MMKLTLRVLTALATVSVALAPRAARALSVGQLPADVRDILSRTIETYRNATTYRDSGKIEIRMNADDAANAHVMPVPLTFERPNRIRFNLDVLAIECDGQELVRYSRVINRYTAEKAPSRLNIADMFGNIPSKGIELFLHLYLLTEPDPLSVVLDQATGASLGADATVDGRPCRTVRFQTPPGRMDGELFIDSETGVLREMRLLAEGKEESLPPGTPAWVSLQLEDVVMNEPVDANAFEFTPPPRAVQVDDLAKPPAEQVAAAPKDGAAPSVGTGNGQLAPDFELATLDGKKIKLSNLRGQVVVLDFWAAWCGPCIRSFPFLERTNKSFAEKPVMIIGVCCDRRSNMSKIEGVVKRAAVTFPIALDRQSKVQGAYGVQSLPTTLVIDQKGVVRAKHRGFSPYNFTLLDQEITRLLGE